MFGEDERGYARPPGREASGVLSCMEMGVNDLRPLGVQSREQARKEREIGFSRALGGKHRNPKLATFRFIQTVAVDRNDPSIDPGSSQAGRQATHDRFRSAALECLDDVRDA